MPVRIATALSAADDIRVACRQAAEQANDSLGVAPALAVLSAPAGAPNLASIGSSALEVLGRDCPLIGYSHAGGVFSGRSWSDRGVGLALLGGDLGVTVGLGPGLASSPLRALDHAAEPLRAAARSERERGRSSQAVLCVADAYAASGDLIVLALRDALGPDPVAAGGLAGDSSQLHATQVVAGEKVLQDAVVLAGICTRTPPAVAIRHGFRPASRTLAVTRARGKILYELDDRPALDVVLEEIRRAGASPPRQREEILSFLTAWPLGFARPLERGELLLRTSIELLPGGAMSFFADVPPGYATFVMHATADEMVAGARAAVESVRRQLGSEMAGMLAFTCGGRLLAMGSYESELAALDCAVPLFGAHVYGEISQTSFQNSSAVVLGFARD